MGDPLTIKLHCSSWGQLDRIYKRDLRRSAIFLKSREPPPLGTAVRINLTLPSETLIILHGEIAEHVPEGGLNGRGPGVDVRLATIPQSAMWLIESALSSSSRARSRARDSSKVQPAPAGATASASRQRRAPPSSTPRAPTEESNLEDGAPVVEAEAGLVAALRAEQEVLRTRNPFQVLGVGYEADDQAVRDAFARLTKKYHPDRYARFQSEDVRELASEVFILIRDAYRRIGSPRARELTLHRLERRRAATKPPMTPRPGPATDEPEPLPPPPSQLSCDELFDRQPAAAPPPPIEVDTSRPSGELDRADQLLEADRVDEALSIYMLASRRNPGDLRARAGVELCEGLRALAQRDRLEAAQRFEMALELAPENERAAHELSEMRRQATQDRKGLLARLLGKKE